MSNPASVSRRRLSLAPVAIALAVAACGPSSENQTSTADTGTVNGQPVTVFVDPNEAGEASTIKVVNVRFGRLVDVYDEEDDDGNPATPGIRSLQRSDFLIGQQVVGDGVLFRLETNPVTERNELTIIADADGANTAPGDALTQREKFALLFETVKSSASTIVPTGTDATFLPPFPMVPRNAALSVQFSDLLDHSRINRDTVRLQTGAPPLAGFEARVIPDPNHGAFVDGVFHTTRVLIDTTISQFEGGGVALALNSVGMPPSAQTGLVNAAVRVPTRVDQSVGQFTLLRNVSGGLVQFSENGPTEQNATRDVVRAFRTGGPFDPSNGFLRDDQPPTIRGSQPVSLPSAPQVVPADAALGDIVVAGDPFEDRSDRVFLVAIDFTTGVCAQTPDVGDFLVMGGFMVPEIYAVVTRTAAPPQGSVASDVRVRLLRMNNVDLDVLAGEFATSSSGRFESSFRPGVGVLPECFLQVSPPPGAPPTTDVSTKPRITVRFSEPMDPDSVLPFDNFRLDRESTAPTPDQVVIGAVTPDPTLREFRYATLTALDHSGSAASRTYFFNVVGGATGVTDLAGNALVNTLPPAVPVTVAASEPLKRTGGIALRFHKPNEFDLTDGAVPPVPFPEVRDEQIERLLTTGVIRPRPVQRSSLTMSGAQVAFGFNSPSQNCPAGAVPIPILTKTPLHPFGSRMMTLWRYCDLGIPLFDPDTTNIDIEGLNWTSLLGSVSTAFFSQFEITLAHTSQLPDGGGVVAPGAFPQSGLMPQFDSNVLADPHNVATVVHNRDRGYLLSPNDTFTGASGVTMLPYPLNRGIAQEDFKYYTWRDTAILALGGPMGGGTEPLDFLSSGEPCFTAQNTTGDLMNGIFVKTIHNPGAVPSIGLPLLMDFKCFPEPGGVHVNNIPLTFFLDTGSTGGFLPARRLYSTGGYTASSVPVNKNPDAETIASGALNDVATSTSCPTGLAVALGAQIPGNGVDNVGYDGQVDYVTRVSRTYTRWFSAGPGSAGFPKYSKPIIEPRAEDLPAGTQIILAFRGANQIGGVDVPNANRYDEYGNPLIRTFIEDNLGTCNDPSDDVFTSVNAAITEDSDDIWKDTIEEIDGFSFFQVRITFISNAANLLRPELSTLAIPFELD